MGNRVVRTIEQMGSEGSRVYSEDQVQHLKQHTNFTAKEIRDWYHTFNKDFPSGVITLDAFVEMYVRMFPQGDASTFAEHVFRAYDADGNGTIDFQEFMTTLSIASHGSIDEKLHWAYSMYDVNGDGSVSRREATDIVHSIFRMRGEFDPGKAEEAVETLFAAVDRDRSDSISEAEFVAGAKHSPDIMDLLRGQ